MGSAAIVKADQCYAQEKYLEKPGFQYDSSDPDASALYSKHLKRNET